MAAKPVSFTALRPEYAALWASMEIIPEKRSTVSANARRIMAHASEYRQAEAETGVPWYVVGLIHAMEAGCSFKCHLHNGDPLTARTRLVPKGRPIEGSPPFSWVESAVDALRYDGLDKVEEWSVPRIAFMLEKFNGFGTRARGIHTPYLWSYTQHYTAGKYIADGVWSATAVSQQCGAMPILKELMSLDKSISPDEDGIADTPWPKADLTPSTATIPDLVPVSRKMGWLQRVREWLGITAITSATGATLADQVGSAQGFLGTVRTIASDNALLIIVGLIVLFAVAGSLFAWSLQRWHVEDYRAGRWVPSKEAL